MSYEPESTAAGPLLASTWETLGPSHIQYNPDEYLQRNFAWQSQHRGQRFYQPLPYGADPTGSNVPAQYASHPLSQYISLLLLLVGVGVLAYYLGRGSAAPQRNPPDENPCCPRSWLPGRRRRRRVDTKLRRARRRQACGQPRDKRGRFA